MSEFRMPSLGADMDAGTLLEWRVKPGDTVARGDIVAVVDTDKATVEIEIFEDGVVEEIVVPEGETVPVGTVLARIASRGEPASRAEAPPESAEPAVSEPSAKPERLESAAPESRPPPAPPETRPASAPATESPLSRPASGRVRATPLARRIARERGIDLVTVTATGPRGEVTRRDVEAAAPEAAAPEAARAARATEEPRVAQPRRPGMRAAIAAAMARSNREIPHYYLETRIDLTRALTWLEDRNRARPVTERILPGALLHKAVALAARRVPEMNGFWEDAGFRAAPNVHLGVAVSLREGGLVAPALRDADQLALEDLMRAMRDVVNRARKGWLRSSELGTATLTVTSLGDRGVEKVFGVIHPPQVALVGFGRIVEEPWAEGGMLAARSVVTATLSADHRASDGYRGARFLAEIRALLEAPEVL